MINFDTRPKTKDTPAATIELFVLDGKSYSIPETIPAKRVLRFMREAKTDGEGAATAGLLVDCIGSEAFDALEAHEDVTEADLRAIFKIVNKAAQGAIERSIGGN